MIEQQENLYSNLFNGSARLGVMLAALNLPWPKTVPYLRAFSEELKGYQELSLDGSGDVLGLMTRGSGQDFAHRVARYMESQGINEERLQSFLTLARYFDYKGLFFKIELDSSGPVEFSYYFRRGASLKEGMAWLKSGGVDDGSLSIVERVAAKLQKESLHFMAASEHINGERLRKIYFSQPEDGQSAGRLYEAGRLVGLTQNSWAPLLPYKALFNRQTTFFSLKFKEGRLCPGAKVDIRGVSPPTVKALMQEAGQGDQAYELAQLLLSTFQKKQYDYLGLRLTPEGTFTTRVYTYKQKLL